MFEFPGNRVAEATTSCGTPEAPRNIAKPEQGAPERVAVASHQALDAPPSIRERRWSSDIAPPPRTSKVTRMDAHTRWSVQAAG